MIYYAHQNNSGGRYIGPPRVFIQSQDGEEAQHQWDMIFDLLDHSYCTCCGERWPSWKLQEASSSFTINPEVDLYVDLENRTHFEYVACFRCVADVITAKLRKDKKYLSEGSTGCPNQVNKEDLLW